MEKYKFKIGGMIILAEDQKTVRVGIVTEMNEDGEPTKARIASLDKEVRIIKIKNNYTFEK